MKAFISAVAVMTLIAVGGWYYLSTLGYSSSDTYKSENVRLGN